MPQWIVDMWTEQLGIEKTEKILEGLLEEHPVTIRLRKDIAEDIEKALKAQGGNMVSCEYPDYAYRIIKTDDITRLPGFDNGGFVVQDISSMMAVEALDINKFLEGHDKSNKIMAVDVCAAPGGKSMLLADIFNREGIENYEIISRDISENKVCLMEEGFKRCGLNRNKAEVWDAVRMDKDLEGKADIVIADVPCSGLGVIGKKRDIKYNITKESITELIKLQEDILRVAAAYLKPGGRLLFSTCTINKDENEEHFLWIKEELGLKPVYNLEKNPSGYTQLLPGIDNSDGFFISVFEK
jgi:16S rRNA (cytosine967-C5)-methyltransferase